MSDGTGPSGLVVIRAGTFFDGTRLADQHVAECLAARGVPVLYVDPPVSSLSPRNDARLAEVLGQPAMREVRPGLHRLTPRVLPAKTRGAMIHVTDVLVRRAITRACGKAAPHVRAVLSVVARPPFGFADERLRVFWARDDYTAGAGLMNLPVARLKHDESRIAAEADLVIAASPALAGRWTAAGLRTVLVPNGCDAEGLADVGAAPTSAPGLPGPVLGLIGTLGERVDFDILRDLAAAGRSLLLVGARQKNFSLDRISDLLDRPNVQWTGPVPYSELPSQLAKISVGLVPYKDNDFNRASFPLKMLEYLAAGRAVVSTDLPAARWLETSLVRIASREDFATAIDQAITEGTGSPWAERRRALAAQHSWSRRTEDILAALTEAEATLPARRTG